MDLFISSKRVFQSSIVFFFPSIFKSLRYHVVLNPAVVTVCKQKNTKLPARKSLTFIKSIIQFIECNILQFKSCNESFYALAYLLPSMDYSFQNLPNLPICSHYRLRHLSL